MHTITHLLKTKVLPWTSYNFGSRFVVAQSEMDRLAVPQGASLTHIKMRGQRTIRRDNRKHNNQRLHIADWPEDNLQEIALPKLVCVVQGRADFRIAKYSLRCEEGTFILVPPGLPHHCNGPFLEEPRRETDSCTLLFARPYSHGVYLWFSRSTGSHHRNNRADNYLVREAAPSQIFRVMLEEAMTAEEDSEEICGDLLHAFFAILAREIKAGRYTHPGPKEVRETSVTSPAGFAGELQEYIEANFNRQIKLADAAAQLYLSTPQFCRRVRQETGATFVELLTRYRIERAQELLRETDWTASAIASHIGFRSASYFQNTFRRRVGKTPTAYRNEKR